MAHPPGPPLFDASHAVQSARRQAPECGVPLSAFPVCYTVSQFGETVILKINLFNDEGFFRLDEQRSGIYFLLGKVVLQELSNTTLNAIPIPFVVSCEICCMRWRGSVLSAALPDLTSGASRPSLSIRCTGGKGAQRTQRVTPTEHFTDEYDVW